MGISTTTDPKNIFTCIVHTHEILSVSLWLDELYWTWCYFHRCARYLFRKVLIIVHAKVAGSKNKARPSLNFTLYSSRLCFRQYKRKLIWYKELQKLDNNCLKQKSCDRSRWIITATTGNYGRIFRKKSYYIEYTEFQSKLEHINDVREKCIQLNKYPNTLYNRKLINFNIWLTSTRSAFRYNVLGTMRRIV